MVPGVGVFNGSISLAAAFARWLMCFMRAPSGAATMKVDATKGSPVNGITELIIFRFHFEPIKERNFSKILT